MRGRRGLNRPVRRQWPQQAGQGTGAVLRVEIQMSSDMTERSPSSPAEGMLLMWLSMVRATDISETSATARTCIKLGLQRDVGCVVRAEVVPQLPYPRVVRPDRVAGDPRARVVGQHLLAPVVGDLLPGDEPPDGA